MIQFLAGVLVGVALGLVGVGLWIPETPEAEVAEASASLSPETLSLKTRLQALFPVRDENLEVVREIIIEARVSVDDLYYMRDEATDMRQAMVGLSAGIDLAESLIDVHETMLEGVDRERAICRALVDSLGGDVAPVPEGEPTARSEA